MIHFQFFWVTFLCCIALILSIIHSIYLSQLFENVRFFSHLADFEREMVYRTEMGLYFSFYKTLINAPNFWTGLHQIINDNVTEYGHTINTLQRFNLYPEIFIGGAYKIMKRFAENYDWQIESCWKVSRGEGLSPVRSCEGFGNYHYFYINIVFGIAGSVLASIFLLGYLLSGSFFGGVISAVAFMVNHGEATRVQWTPPLRESFGYPVFIAQILVLSYILKYNSKNKFFYVTFSFLTTNFLLCWQFAQFMLATQLGSIFLTYLLNFIKRQLLIALLKSYLISFLLALTLLFANSILLNSLFSNSLTAITIMLVFEKKFQFFSKKGFFYFFLSTFTYLLIVFGGKIFFSFIFNIRDDNHVMDILLAKFFNYATFHTRLYTCAEEFDFIGFETTNKLVKTLLLPSTGLSLIILTIYFLKTNSTNTNKKKTKVKSTSSDNDETMFSEIIYNVIQFFCFAILAILIMRLKLFATPHLCILSSLLANKSLFNRLVSKRLAKYQLAFIFALIGYMTYIGKLNISEQLKISGEYNNIEQENLFDWIIRSTKPSDVFAGSMPVMANVKLSTLRPIVNHPHYENEETRNRTLKVYSMYSRKPINEVYATLKNMMINYYIFQPSSCIESHPNPQCNYLQMWDLEDVLNRSKKPFCKDIIKATKADNVALKKIRSYFKIVYKTEYYVVLSLI